MERTIDGIDYIAKSEVLRIIDEEVREANDRLGDAKLSDMNIFGWACRLRGLRDLRHRIASREER